MYNSLKISLKNAEKRLGSKTNSLLNRHPRSDRGGMRLSPQVADKLTSLVASHERLSVKRMCMELEGLRKINGPQIPTRATIYQFMAKASTPSYPVNNLPESVQTALYNLNSESSVPGHQVAFYCFNYGDLAAISFAAGLPWLALYQASRLRGFRPKSRGLLEAVLRARGI